MSGIRNLCWGPNGRPDIKKVKAFMRRRDRRSRFDAAGWALFFIWVGIAWLTDVSMGVGLLGVAVVTLGMQGLRKIYDVPVEGFWILVGFGFAIAAVWQWFAIETPMAPLILIAVGIALLIWRVLPRSHHHSF